MKLPGTRIEQQRQEVAVAFPQRQRRKLVDADPLQGAFGIVGERRAVPGVDEEDETEPGFAVLAEARPANGAAQAEAIAFQSCLFADFPFHGGDDVLACFHLAAEAVVFAEVMVLWPTIAMDEEDAVALRAEDVAEGGEDGGEGHGGLRTVA